MPVSLPKPNEADGLATQCRMVGLPEPLREWTFHPKRKWRFDLAFCNRNGVKLAVEVDGGVWINGRHSRGAGVEKDCEKYAEAMCLGWRVLRVTPKHIRSGEAVNWIERLLR